MKTLEAFIKNFLNNNDKVITKFNLNIGPQHPASHGVLRVVVALEGEIVSELDPQIGFLHRASEKLAEFQPYVLNVVYMDRLDYTSVLTQTHAYCITVECATKVENYDTLTAIARTIFDELARILNHLLAISTHSLDVGSMATLFWAFEDRERIMEILEYVSGARMHTAMYLPNEHAGYLLTIELLNKIVIFLKQCQKTFSEMFIVLYNNRVWKLRLVDIGILNVDDAYLFGASGPILRGSGCFYDNRSNALESYAYYNNISFKTFLGIRGDCFDRYLIRSRELFEAMHIIYSCIGELCIYSECIHLTLHNFYKYNFYPIKLKIESLVKLFKKANADFYIDSTFCYKNVEAGKGEIGVALITNNDNKPYRLYIRSPAFAHLQLLGKMCKGHCFADIITLLGTLDLVFGEVDR